MEYLLLAASVLLNVLACGILRSAYCRKHVKNSADLHLFNAVSSVVTMAGLALISALGGSLCMPSLYTALFGVLFGLVTAGCAISHMKALEIGPLSYTNVIGSCAMVIPALSGLVLYNEPVSLWQYVGMGLVLLALILAVDRRQRTCAPRCGGFCTALRCSSSTAASALCRRSIRPRSTRESSARS